MKPNERPAVWEAESFSGGRIFEVTDYTLFMYGLVRGDVFVAGGPGKPVYGELQVWELDGVFRLGIPYFERRSFLTRLSGLVTASKVEFSVPPERRPNLIGHGFVTVIVQSAFRGRRERTPGP